MNRKKNTLKEISSLMVKNQSFESYFSNYFMSKNNIVTVNKNYNESPFVVEWQMENDKQDV